MDFLKHWRNLYQLIMIIKDEKLCLILINTEKNFQQTHIKAEI